MTTSNRSYDDACGLARALDVVGERWAMLVVRELVLGPKRFTDLRTDLPGVSSNVLSTRLGQLEKAGVVTRHKLPPPAATWVYELTPWGQELEPVIRVLGRWGARTQIEAHHQTLSATSAVLSMRTNFDPSAAAGVTGSYELHLNEDTFRAEVRDREFSIVRGQADRPDAVIETDPVTWAGVLFSGLDLDEAAKSGAAKISGDEQAVARLIKLFSLPEPVPAA